VETPKARPIAIGTAAGAYTIGEYTAPGAKSTNTFGPVAGGSPS
jgi:hypothetical protein